MHTVPVAVLELLLGIWKLKGQNNCTYLFSCGAATHQDKKKILINPVLAGFYFCQCGLCGVSINLSIFVQGIGKAIAWFSRFVLATSILCYSLFTFKP
jgi:hypothetical protein